MANGDFKLDGSTAIVEGNWLHVKCLDLKLDSSARRSSNSGERRALVHGFNDELVINYNGDYPGGVTIRGEIHIPDKIKQGHLRCESHDLHLDHPDRRTSTSGSRRAMVHGFDDELALNYNKDYPGGTVVHGDLDVKKNGTFKIINSSNDTIAQLDRWGNLALGGGNQDGDIMLKDGNGDELIRIDTQNNRLDFKNSDGSVKVRIHKNDFTGSAWPTLPGESAPSRLDLIKEIRRLKEEIVTLRSQVDTLMAGG